MAATYVLYNPTIFLGAINLGSNKMTMQGHQNFISNHYSCSLFLNILYEVKFIVWISLLLSVFQTIMLTKQL